MKIENTESTVLFADGMLTLYETDGVLTVSDGENAYRLTSHPYEPCVYLSQNGRIVCTVHNAFTENAIRDAAVTGERLVSVTGNAYDAAGLCRVLLNAAKKCASCDFGYAEKLFAGMQAEQTGNRPENVAESNISATPNTESVTELREITEDPFFSVLARYPACCVDYCLVQSTGSERGVPFHRKALKYAVEKVSNEIAGGDWTCDVTRAAAHRIPAEALFGLPPDFRAKNDGGPIPYRYAFLEPPHGTGPVWSKDGKTVRARYADVDFDLLNRALFPYGADPLTVYEWTADWADYFNDGREWWGTGCWTVYDAKADRCVVILAAATD